MLKQIDNEIDHKSEFADKCLKEGDLGNANYYKAFVHGLEFAKYIIIQMERSEIKIPHYGIWNTKHSCFIGFENSSLFWTTSIDVASEQLKRWQQTNIGDNKYLEVREIGEAVSISCYESDEEAC